MSSRCGKCGSTMKEGFLVDMSQQAMRVGHWAEGAPEFRFGFFLKMRGRRKLPIRSFRCMKCGYLESYAADDSPS